MDTSLEIEYSVGIKWLRCAEEYYRSKLNISAEICLASKRQKICRKHCGFHLAYKNKAIDRIIRTRCIVTIVDAKKFLLFKLKYSL